jgi:acyl carrier protein
MFRMLLVFLACLTLGCTAVRETDTQRETSGTLAEVQSVVANQLGKTDADIDPDATFATLGADDLDLVEITMEVEEAFGIVIRDEALVMAANVSSVDELCAHLTIRTFAKVAEAAPKQSALPVRPDAGEDGAVRDSQVGAYGELSLLPNPHGLVLVFIPSVEELTRLTEQRLGRKMNADEIEALRQQAAVIALPPEKAQEFEQERRDRKAADNSD